MADWQNRIIGEGIEDADQLLANPFNARIHPKFQQDALSGVLDNMGWIQRVIVNQTTGHVIDGHLRVALAITKGAKVPVTYVELTEDEEKLALLSFDWITQMAVYDQQKTEELLTQVNSDNAAIQAMLTQLGTDVGIIPPDNPYDEWRGMPEFDPEPLAFRSIHIHFKSQDDVDKFARLIEQQITDKTRSLWYPYQEKRDLKSVGYISDES